MSSHGFERATQVQAGKPSSFSICACNSLPFLYCTRILFTHRAKRFASAVSAVRQGYSSLCAVSHRFDLRKFFCQSDLRLPRGLGALTTAPILHSACGLTLISPELPISLKPAHRVPVQCPNYTTLNDEQLQRVASRRSTQAACVVAAMTRARPAGINKNAKRVCRLAPT